MKSKKIIMSFAGVMITAISIGAFKFAAFGVDPFQSFMCGIDTLIPIDFGSLYVIVNTMLLLFALAFDRHYIGIATFLNLFLLGYVVDISQGLITALFPNPSLVTRSVFFLLGFVFLCLGSSLYMTADMGVSTYDAIALICTNKWKLARFQTIRIITDFVCIGLGAGMYIWGNGTMGAITSVIGIGTIVTAFCMGPLINWFYRTVSEKLLEDSPEHQFVFQKKYAK